MLTVEPAGRLVRFTTKVADADVILPAESFDVTNVIDAVPVATDSAFVMGGTSFAGDRVAVNVGFVGVVDVGVVELLQPAARSAIATATGGRRFIVKLSF